MPSAAHRQGESDQDEAARFGHGRRRKGGRAADGQGILHDAADGQLRMIVNGQGTAAGYFAERERSISAEADRAVVRDRRQGRYRCRRLRLRHIGRRGREHVGR